MEHVRLQRYLARCGLGSRRACEMLIEEGRVSVNGKTVVEPGTRIAEGDTVRVDGEAVSPTDHRYFIINKPPGVISVDQDLRGRKYVVDLIPSGRKMGLFPVGRLDLDTTGLMIITNDGELANRIAHPRFGIPKEYTALIKGNWSVNSLRKITSNGVKLDDGYLVKDIEVLKAIIEGTRTRATIRIKEGRKHVVKRIFLALGSRVYELHRDAVGGLRIDDLDIGRWYESTKDHISSMIGP